MSIYLDNSATTKIRPEALKKYNEISENVYGNPSSLHEMGFLAEKELECARDIIRATVADTRCDVVFTSSGTEANNLAIIGRALSKERYKNTKRKIITTLGEHSSVSAPISYLESLGFKCVSISTEGGKIDLDALMRELTDDVILVSVMMVNNETGALYDVREVARLTHMRCPEAAVHVDATQSYMKVAFTKKSLGADMITVSSHKIEGPKGVGALIIDEKLIKSKGVKALTLGGGQENDLRSGTENVPGVCAFAEAARLAHAELSQTVDRLSLLRDYLIEKISADERLSGISITDPASHAPHILNITLPSIKSETMLHYLSSLGIYVSSGSACSSNSSHTSSALTAYGRTQKEADSSIRIRLSRRNTKEELDALIEGLASGISRLAKIR